MQNSDGHFVQLSARFIFSFDRNRFDFLNVHGLSTDFGLASPAITRAHVERRDFCAVERCLRFQIEIATVANSSEDASVVTSEQSTHKCHEILVDARCVFGSDRYQSHV